MKALAIALVLSLAGFAPPQESGPYKFSKEKPQVFDVVGELMISLQGSHRDLLEKGNETPLRLEYRARFENSVVKAASDGNPASLSRKARTLTATGAFKGEAFKVEYDDSRPEEKRFSSDSGQWEMVRFLKSWCTTPFLVAVDGLGGITVDPPDFNRLIVKAGMMYWPVKADAATWVTREKLAVPLFHHKILFDFDTTFVRTEIRKDRKFMILDAKARLAGTEPPAPEAPKEIVGDPTFKAGGDARIEIDLTTGELHKVSLQVKVDIAGEAQVSDGSMAVLRGEVTFKETQTRK